MFASLRIKHGVRALETEEEPPWRDIILSPPLTVFTASADLEGLLQCVRESLLLQDVFVLMVFAVMCRIVFSSPIHSLIMLKRKIRNSGGWDTNPGSISRSN